LFYYTIPNFGDIPERNCRNMLKIHHNLQKEKETMKHMFSQGNFSGKRQSIPNKIQRREGAAKIASTPKLVPL
jgi:hypothetical protein